MSNLVKHAEYELSLLGNDEMQLEMNKHLLKMVKIFSDEGHSGSTAGYAINVLNKLLKYEPLTPLTGDESEWNAVSDGVYQNKRCGRIFKQKDRFDGKPYDIDAIVFVENDGAAYTSSDSLKVIEFPYIPKTSYIQVDNKDSE